MNWSHLKAMMWMRWRVLVNRIRRAGKLNNTVFLLVLFAGLLFSCGMFVVALAAGIALLPEADPMSLMFTWLALAGAFFVFWLLGLVTDLQRSDTMSFKNLLHLPISLGWVFLYNYLSSFVSISIALVMPAMLGLSVAMVIVHGPWMLFSFPLVFGYFGMITAITYQLRGWLAKLMEDKRRGRNVVAMITFGLVIVLQLPNLINISYSSSRRAEREAERLELAVLVAEGGELSPESGTEPGLEEAVGHSHGDHEAKDREEDAEKATLDRQFSLGAMIVPIGWLPYGVRAAFEGRGWISALCAAGMFLLGALSLKRSYHKTLAAYLGAGSGGTVAVAAGVPASLPLEPAGERETIMVERLLPFSGEAQSGIAMAGLRSILRAPEGKLLLLGPVIILLIFGVMFWKSAQTGLAGFGPLVTLGATTMGLLCISQLIQNQFGLDRAGFRAYVLSPVPRDLILRGKNLGTAPIALVVACIALLGVQFMAPQDLLHFAGAFLQAASIFMVLCMIGNATSILLPMRLKAGGMKAANPTFKTIVSHMLSVMFIPVALSPLLIPWGVEGLFHMLDWPGGALVYLALHALVSFLVYRLYCSIVARQGALLQNREQQILEVLTRE